MRSQPAVFYWGWGDGVYFAGRVPSQKFSQYTIGRFVALSISNVWLSPTPFIKLYKIYHSFESAKVISFLRLNKHLLNFEGIFLVGSLWMGLPF